MTVLTSGQDEFEMHISQVAGKVHRQVMDEIMPWIRGDETERKRLVQEALSELKSTSKITADEYQQLHEVIGDIGREGAGKESVLEKINTHRQSHANPPTPLYATLLSIAADSVRFSDAVPIAAADLAGGIFGGVVGGGLGALGGAIALSAFTAS